VLLVVSGLERFGAVWRLSISFISSALIQGKFAVELFIAGRDQLVLCRQYLV
jgi:hypothetical protein